MEWLNKDNFKIKLLNEFMESFLNAGTGSEKKSIIDLNKDLIDTVKPIDLFYLDTYQEDKDVEIIKETANKFMNLFYEGLSKPTYVYEHVLYKHLLDENTAVEKHLKSMKELLKGDTQKNKKELLLGFEKCLEFDKKFQKFENIIFPNLEDKLPSNKPLQVLWSLYDDARILLKELIMSLNKDGDNFVYLVGQYYFLIYGIIQKEQLILLPVTKNILSNDLLDKMLLETSEYGFTLIDVEIVFSEVTTKSLEGVFNSKTGGLSFKQLTLMLNRLPVDITYVDKFNRVKYFNDNPNRHFPRNPSVIGRQVKYCHPPKSVAMVERIIDAFKNKEKDFAEFWMNFRGNILYITYYALYDSDGSYEGVLETSQDVTHIKSLEGEKRLLDWDE